MLKMLLSGACLAAVAATMGAAAHAQENGGLEEIIVTARRQAENLQSVPVAVTAVTGAELQRMNMQQTSQIARITPNLTISQQPSYLTAAAITIRGIGQTNPSMGLDTSVGVYLDGVYVARSAASILDLVDAERVEVLRGPQGTLFGRNTTGGALQIISKKPAEELGLSIRGGYGSRNSWFAKGRFDTGAMGGSPLSAAFTFQHRQSDGYFDNYYTSGLQDPGSLIANSFLGQLRGDFGSFKADYSFDYDKRKGAPAFFQIVAAAPDVLKYFGNSQALGGTPFQIKPDGRLDAGWVAPTRNARPGFNPFLAQAESWGHNLSLSWEVADALTVKSITGYRGLDINISHGTSGNGIMRGIILDPVTFAPSVGQVTTYGGFDGPQTQKQFSEELQFLGDVGDFSYVAGLYYFWERSSERNVQELTFVLPGGDAGMNLWPIIAYTARSKSYAAFGQVSYKPQALDGKLELTGGIRYTKDKKKIHLKDTEGGMSTVIGDPEGAVSFSNFSFLGSASYRLENDVMLYAKIATGYKSGGLNPQVNFLNSFAPEKLTSVEGGVKADWFDRKLRTNISLFWSRYRDLQVTQFASGTSGATALLVNAGRATFKGIEGEIVLSPSRAWALSASFGYTDMKYNEFLFRDPDTNQIEDIARTAHFPTAAKFNSNIALDYFFPEMDMGKFAARIAWAHRSRVIFYPNDTINPFNQLVASPAQDDLTARISLSEIPLGARAKGEIALTGNNILNQNHVAYGIDFGGLGFGGMTYAEPRRLGVEFTVKY